MTVESKEQCPSCADSGADGSANNLVTFKNGSSFCFACSKDTKKDVKNEEDPTNRESRTVQPDSSFKQGRYKELVKRNISEDTCRKYGYMVGDKSHIANVLDTSGNVVYQKIRTIPDKQFYSVGDNSFSNTLYGSWLFTPNPKIFITITEGELDCLSVYEAFRGEFDTPVVSVLQGASSAEKTDRKNLDYLQGFRYVVLAFDEDEAGRKATEACLQLFEPGKVRVAKWSQKDASDLLQEGKSAEIRKTIYRAVQYMPEPIKTGTDLLKTLDNYATKTKEWPWKAANETIAPIHIPAVYTIAAKPAVGKTLFCHELMKSVIDAGGKVGIIALEETLQKVLLKVTSSLFNVDLVSVCNREFTEDEKEMCAKAAESLVVYDHIAYGSDIQQICANIPYMVRSCGCDLIIFDNLSYSATGTNGNERVGIDKAMVHLKDSTVKYEYTLLNVCHLKRDDNDFDEFKPITAESIRGSQGVEMYSDYIIGLDRNKSSEDMKERNTLSVHVLKDRMSGQDTGKIFKLYYNKTKGRLESGGGEA